MDRKNTWVFGIHKILPSIAQQQKVNQNKVGMLNEIVSELIISYSFLFHSQVKQQFGNDLVCEIIGLA